MTSTQGTTIAALACIMLIVAASCWIAHAAPEALPDMASVLSSAVLAVGGVTGGVGVARQAKKAIQGKQGPEVSP